jgi:hypothetical protein
MRDELARSMRDLRFKDLPKPYFIAYRVDETERREVAATLGSLLHEDGSRGRRLTVEVRIGDYVFDNTNFIGVPTRSGRMTHGVGATSELPLDDDYGEIRRQLWLATDGAYKDALEQLARKRALLESTTREEKIPDFARESVVTTADDAPAPPVSREGAEAIARNVSRPFRDMAEVYGSIVECSAGVAYTRYVNSEGSSFTRTAPWAVLHVEAHTQAEDGTPLSDFFNAYGASVADLQALGGLSDSARELGDRLARLRHAAASQAYQGPVLFEGQAAAELFRELFAPRLLARRRPMSDNPMFKRFAADRESRFLDEIGRRVLPNFMSVADNSLLPSYDGHFVGGSRVDDDGVPTRETKIVDHGILRTLLTTRVPVRGILRSSGNRRGNDAVIGTLLVTVDSGLSGGSLRRKLLEVAAARGVPYGVVVRRIADPATLSMEDQLILLASFDPSGQSEPPLTVTEAYKVFSDGHEELMRKAEISGLTAAMFREIVAASMTQTVYSVPSADARFGSFDLPDAGVGAVSTYAVPALLFEQVSVRPPTGEVPRLPILTSPLVPGH